VVYVGAVAATVAELVSRRAVDTTANMVSAVTGVAGSPPDDGEGIEMVAGVAGALCEPSATAEASSFAMSEGERRPFAAGSSAAMVACADATAGRATGLMTDGRTTSEDPRADVLAGGREFGRKRAFLSRGDADTTAS
jgi:hypothetical protein